MTFDIFIDRVGVTLRPHAGIKKAHLELAKRVEDLALIAAELEMN